MNGMILAAGLGERMEPLSSVVPKPALEVLGRPLLASAVENLRDAGCGRIVVNLHRHPARVAAAARGVAADEVSFSWEPELLGGAGGVAAACGLLGDGDVLVGNADAWGRLDLGPALAAREDDAVVLALIPHPDPSRWSSVVVDGAGAVTRFLPPGAGVEGERFLFTGFQIFGRRVVATLPSGRREMAALWSSARERGRLRGVEVQGGWREAGTPASYRDLVVASLAGAAWVHPSAAVEDGSRLERSAVGAGCSVAGSAVVAECVLTAGATVGPGAILRRCVLAGPINVAGETVSDTLLVPDRRVALS